MKKLILLAISIAVSAPLLHAEMKKTPAAPETKATEEPKKAADPKVSAEEKAAAAKLKAETLTTEQTAKLLELVNKGEAKAIQEIKGVGPKRSQSIIAKRPYAKVEELAAVGDIGAGTFDDIIAFAKGEQAAAPKKEAAPKKAEMK